MLQTFNATSVTGDGFFHVLDKGRLRHALDFCAIVKSQPIRFGDPAIFPSLVQNQFEHDNGVFKVAAKP
ncbi:MAG: hypothetical protein SGARI_002134 [Bacillariaceae sp.]